MIKAIAFDLETSLPSDLTSRYQMDVEIERLAELGKRFDMWQYGEFGITCAATKGSNGLPARTWFSWQDSDAVAPTMSKSTALALLNYLCELKDGGHSLVTWNGTAFDWRVLATVTEQYSLCTELALTSYDPMFQMLCIKGYPVGVEAVCQGLGIKGKSMTGLDAVELWPAYYEQVLEYVSGDVDAELAIFEHVQQDYGLTWINSDGDLRFYPFVFGPLTVRQCLKLPTPDTSWMTNPITREDQLSWMSL